jgi:hypothetical protein
VTILSVRFCGTQAARRYTLRASPDASVGQVARYLSQHDIGLDTNTLEVAFPLPVVGTVRDSGLQRGDRLLLLSPAEDEAQLPIPPRPGDHILRFSLDEVMQQSGTKRRVVAGKPDETRGFVPDIDLRAFAPPRFHSFISRACLQFDFDSAARLWYATRLGVTRVMIDEFELGSEPAPLDAARWLRFYRATDEPRHPDSQAIGRVRVEVAVVEAERGLTYLAPGDFPVNIVVGTEREPLTLNVSDALPVERVIEGLSANGRLSPDAALLALRLLPPQTPLGAVGDGMLYAGSRPTRLSRQ